MRAVPAFAALSLAALPAVAAGVADALAPIQLTVPAAKYRDPDFIRYQTGPSVAVSAKGRIWVAIMTGGRDEGNLNYIDLLTSGDGGRTWSEPKLALDIDGPLRTFDPAMWTDPEGRVWLFWCQCYDFWDGRGGLWASVCENPDDENAAWSKPRRLCDGVMKDKPLVLANGDRWLFVEQWQDDTQPHVWKALSKLPKLPEWYHTDTPHVGANVYCSKDRGRTWNWLSTVPVPKDIRTCDEHMAVELKDGTFRMLLRVKTGMAESTSADGGRTWTTAAPGAIKNPAGRFFFGRLRSGNILLVKNGPIDRQTDRRDLMAYLSEDDGRTFPYKLELDMRKGVAYPDVSERADGLIHCVHDFDRRKIGEIVLDQFTEADIRAGRLVSPQSRLHTIVRQNAQPKVESDHANGLYRCGETAVFSAKCLSGRGQVKVWIDDGGPRVVTNLTVDTSKTDTLSLSASRTTPGALRLRLKFADGSTKMYGVLYDWEKIMPAAEKPADFESYWKGERERLAATVPLDPKMERVPERDTADRLFYRLSFATFGGKRVHGAMTVPREGKGPFPVRFHCPGAGPGKIEPLPCESGTVVCEPLTPKNAIGVVMNINDFPVQDTREAQKRRAYLWSSPLFKKYGVRNYMHAGFSVGRDEVVFHDPVLGILRGLDWLAEQPFADAAHFTYYGSSQGAALGYYLAALWGRFERTMLNVPAMGDLLAARIGRTPGGPDPVGGHPAEVRATCEATAPYYDTANFATMIKTPVLVVIGLADDTCPFIAAVSSCNRLATRDRRVCFVPGMGHSYAAPRAAGFTDWLNEGIELK